VTNADLALIAAIKKVADYPHDLPALTNAMEAALNAKQADLAIAILHIHYTAAVRLELLTGFQRIINAIEKTKQPGIGS
jgi:hypothetical protein